MAGTAGGGAYDYIVVGAGSAGCAVAARLSEDPNTTVLLLEAGGSDDHPLIAMPMGFLKALRDPRFAWNYMGEPEPYLNNRQMWLPRGKMLGGSSSINGMFYMRGHSQDFETWRQMGCTGWGYADVLPYFKRMETSWRGEGKHHGGSGPVHVAPIDKKGRLHEPLVEAARALGYPISADIHAEEEEGFALGEVTIDPRGRRSSASRAYLRPARRRRNLRVVSKALTTRVLFENRRAVGVEIRRDGATERFTARREVILSGGAYNSPQLLMLSGIGPAEQLRALGIEVLVDSPGVGGNLSEHPVVMMEFEATGPVTFLRELRLDRAVVSVIRWALTGKGAFASQVSSCNVALRTRPELAQPDLQLMCNPVRMDADLWGFGLKGAREHRFGVGVVGLHPHSRGRLSLASADPTKPPKILLNLFSDPADFQVMRAGVRLVRKLYRTEPQARLTGAELVPGPKVETDEEIDDFVRREARTVQHPVGTCSMGIGPEAVVDPELRVRGVEGLRVVDASIMPTVPGANTNAASIMVGERGADLIRGRSLAHAEL